MGWLTTKDGRRVNTDWFDEKFVQHYSQFIDKPEEDYKLDSDEKVWVQQLRDQKLKDQQINRNNNEAAQRNTENKIKPWSTSEQKRSEQMSAYVMKHLNAGDEWGEFYEENPVEEFEPIPLKFPGFKDDEVSITKMNLIYTQNYDENDMRVKRGKAVTGSTYYVVQTNDGSINESTFAYKTKADAEHAMQLYIQELAQFRNKR